MNECHASLRVIKHPRWLARTASFSAKKINYFDMDWVENFFGGENQENYVFLKNNRRESGRKGYKR